MLTDDIHFSGLESIQEPHASLFKAKVLHIFEKWPDGKVSILISNEAYRESGQESRHRKSQDPEITLEQRAAQFGAIDAEHDFEFLVVPPDTRQQLMNAVGLLSVKNLVFNDWGLKTIEPHPTVALNFYGPPGTGKTLAAHAIATELKRKLLAISCSALESKFHGEGPKNIDAIFYAAKRDNAILFIDEADSLLSKRIANVTQAADQAINSMRSQMLLSLDAFDGIVIFATNFVQSYDRAFETRVRHIEFKMPDESCRRAIWEKHLVPQLPRSNDVTADKLARVEDVCGRDIKNAIIEIAVEAAINRKPEICFTDLEKAILDVKARRISSHSSTAPLSAQEKKQAELQITRKLSQSARKARKKAKKKKKAAAG